MPTPDRPARGELFAEAERQLKVCNSCRYCEGYCPVWTGLELRTTLAAGDVLHLANLCHDCRDCYSACMYVEPHEFALNPPRLFAELRQATYRDFLWRPRWAARLPRIALLAITALLAVACVTALAATTGNATALTSAGSGSPYALIPHLALVALMAAPVAFGLAVLIRGLARYWAATHATAGDLTDVRAWAATLAQSATLAHMDGGGQGCDYVGDQPGTRRRWAHHLIAYGFGLCLVATTSAAAVEQFTGRLPPYPLLSVPVATGTLGGLMLAVGAAVLLCLERRADPAQGTPAMRLANTAMLADLAVVALTGLATLAARRSDAFGALLAVHLAAVLATFAVFPYSKFVHWPFRMLAIYKHNLETGRRGAG